MLSQKSGIHLLRHGWLQNDNHTAIKKKKKIKLSHYCEQNLGTLHFYVSALTNFYFTIPILDMDFFVMFIAVGSVYPGM